MSARHRLQVVVSVLTATAVMVFGPFVVAAAADSLLHSNVVQQQQQSSNDACKLLSIVPYSDQSVFTMRTTERLNPIESYGNLTRWTAQTIGLTGYTYTAAIRMAMDHFNLRNTAIVPELAHLPRECDTVHFSDDSIVADGALNNIIAGQIVLNATQDPNLCAILGPYGIIPASWTTPITNSLNVPQIFYSMALTDVTEQDLYPTSVRTSLIPYDHAAKLLSWLQHNGRTHLGVIHGSSDYDREYAMVLSQYGEMYGVNTTIFALTPQPPGKNSTFHASQAYFDVEFSGIRTLFRIFDAVGPKELEKLAAAANHHGLLASNGYLWILDDHMAPVDDLPSIVQSSKQAPPGSPIDKLISGAIIIAPSESWEGGNADSSRFVQSWKSMNSSFVDRVNAMVPLASHQIEYMQAPHDFFQTTMPRRGAELVYDSVMAIGFGACSAVVSANPSSSTNATAQSNSPGPGRHRFMQEESPAQDGQSPPPPPQQPKQHSLAHDNAHVQGIIRSVFTGASGRVAFGKLGSRYKDRVPEDLLYGAYQIRPITLDDATTRQYEVVMVERSTPTGAWETVNGESFTNVDGGSPTDPFGSPRVAVIPNYLPQWARNLGLALMVLAWTISIGLTGVVWKWQDKPYIRAGQPIYLYVLCLGSFVTSSAILPLSFDEHTGSTAAQLDTACTVTPWLFFIGINSMFAGLFCKLWRIEKVTQFRRQQVKAIQTVWPLILLLTSTVICLIVWTVEDPWVWERVDVNETPYETFGQCQSDHFAVYFSLLCVIMIVATGLAFVMAWKTKDLNIDSRFSDSNAVFLAIASQLQAWFLGLPVLAVLGDSSAEATYLGRVLLIWLFAMASVWIVVVPKIYRTCRELHNPSHSPRTSRVFVSGLNTADNNNIQTTRSSQFTDTTPDVSAAASKWSGGNDRNSSSTAPTLSTISKESERMEL